MPDEKESAEPRLALLLHSSRKAERFSWTDSTLRGSASHGLGADRAACTPIRGSGKGGPI